MWSRAVAQGYCTGVPCSTQNSYMYKKIYIYITDGCWRETEGERVREFCLGWTGGWRGVWLLACKALERLKNSKILIWDGRIREDLQVNTQIRIQIIFTNYEIQLIYLNFIHFFYSVSKFTFFVSSVRYSKFPFYFSQLSLSSFRSIFFLLFPGSSMPLLRWTWSIQGGAWKVQEKTQVRDVRYGRNVANYFAYWKGRKF